jgi:hypothetical protein
MLYLQAKKHLYSHINGLIVLTTPGARNATLFITELSLLAGVIKPERRHSCNRSLAQPPVANLAKFWQKRRKKNHKRDETRWLFILSHMYMRRLYIFITILLQFNPHKLIKRKSEKYQNGILHSSYDLVSGTPNFWMAWTMKTDAVGRCS